MCNTEGDSSPILSVSGLYKRFGGLVATDDVTFHVDQGEILGIIGPNGAGKSTLFGLLAGLIRPDRGVVKFNGRDVSRLPAYRVSRRGMVKTFQNTKLFDDLSASENVMTAAMYSNSVRKARSIARVTLDRVGASSLAGLPVADLTMAQRVRVEIARALATRPRLLMLDEIFSPLDRDEIADLSGVVRSLREDGLTILMIEHHMPPLLRLVDRIMALNYGSVLAIGDPEVVMRDERVVSAYLGTK